MQILLRLLHASHIVAYNVSNAVKECPKDCIHLDKRQTANHSSQADVPYHPNRDP